MGCASCGGNSVTITVPFQQNNIVQASDEFCEYNNENLQDFYNKLTWFKQTGKYLSWNGGAPLLNKYLGIVLTSLNINRKCEYKSDLDAIADLVIYINILQNG